MKSTLSEILEAEKNARKSIDKAEEYRRSVIDGAQLAREQIIAERLQKANEKIEDIRAQLEVRREKKLEAVRQAGEAELAMLEKMRKENEEQWIEELYRRTLGEQ